MFFLSDVSEIIGLFFFNERWYYYSLISGAISESDNEIFYNLELTSVDGIDDVIFGNWHID